MQSPGEPAGGCPGYRVFKILHENPLSNSIGYLVRKRMSKSISGITKMSSDIARNDPVMFPSQKSQKSTKC